ncbi:MAG: hypothetical protein AB1393_13825 [Candidatus Edwardsbacteria bacterium]
MPTKQKKGYGKMLMEEVFRLTKDRKGVVTVREKGLGAIRGDEFLC